MCLKILNLFLKLKSKCKISVPRSRPIPYVYHDRTFASRDTDRDFRGVPRSLLQCYWGIRIAPYVFKSDGAHMEQGVYLTHWPFAGSSSTEDPGTRMLCLEIGSKLRSPVGPRAFQQVTSGSSAQSLASAHWTVPTTVPRMEWAGSYSLLAKDWRVQADNEPLPGDEGTGPPEAHGRWQPRVHVGAPSLLAFS